MYVIDISWPITRSMTFYKDRSSFEVSVMMNFEEDKARETIFTMGSHVGTHVDAPSHFLEDGEMIHQVPLASLVGACRVIDCTTVVDKITAQDLMNHDITSGLIVLLKTKNSFKNPNDRFDPAFVYLEESAARFLVSKKIKAVGIDYLGIERNQADHQTHKALFENAIVIIEGLRLAHVEPGSYTFICLPLFVKGMEAAPARAVLLQKKERLLSF